MTVGVAEDRSMRVQPNQVVRTPMRPEAVEKKYRRLLNLGECAPWPPIVGHWEQGRFVVCDGRGRVHQHLRGGVTETALANPRHR